MADIAVLLRSGPHRASTTTRYALKCSDIAIQVTKTPIQIPMPVLPPQLIDIGMFRPSITLTGIVDNAAVNTNVTKAGGDSVLDFEGMEIIPHTNPHVETTVAAGASQNATAVSVTSTDGLQPGYVVEIDGNTQTIAAVTTEEKSPTNAGSITINALQSGVNTGALVYHAGQTLNYYIPYKNKLEDHIYTLVAENDINLELEVGAAEHHELLTHTHGSGSHTHGSTGGGIYQVAIQQARFQLNAAKEDRWDFTMQLVSRSREGYL